MAYRRKRQRRARRPQNKFKRRGFGLDVNLGKNVPFLGGSTMRLGTRNVRRMVRREIMKSEETKIRADDITITASGGGLKNNTFYSIAPTRWITKGTNDYERTGEKIFLKHLTLRLQLQSVYYPTEVRIMGILHEKNVNPQASGNGLYQTLGSNDLFYGTNGYYTHAFINNKLGATLLCDKLIHFGNPNTNSGTRVPDLKTITLDCPINKQMQYAPGDASNGFNDMQFYWVIVCSAPDFPPYAVTSTVVTTGTAQTIVTYKDA